MGDRMEFPKDWKKFLEDYSFKDKEEIYTNGARLIPTFRVEQMMEHYLRKATEDAVPVVRCKDCKWGCSPYGDEDDGWTACANIHGRPIFRDEHFCSSGERRTDA